MTGESGIGKSALLCNWAKSYKEAHPRDVLVSFHIGCAAETTGKSHKEAHPRDVLVSFHIGCAAETTGKSHKET